MNRISSDLHDEVGNLLSGITMQTQMLPVIPEENKTDFIKEIGQNTRRAVSTMRDLVWSIDSRRDLMDRISDACQQLLEPAGFQYEFDISGDLDQLKKLNPKAKKEIFLIAKEAINNIVKHSNGDEVSIALAEKNRQLELIILDNGTQSQNTSTSGQGLENMQHRTQQINGELKVHQNSQGYEVKLLVPL